MMNPTGKRREQATFQRKKNSRTKKKNIQNKTPLRLNRYLALIGLGSRRACDELIKSGRISVDSKKITSLATSIQPGENIVYLDGRPLEKPKTTTILVLNKPAGVVSTASDPEGRPTVIDLCKKIAKKKRLFPVGRLDINTSGVILLTNDGALCYRLTHPRFQIPRTYLARVRGAMSDKKIDKLNRLAGHGQAKNHSVGMRPKVEPVKQLKHESILRITLHEGKNRQVRKMCEAVGFRVVKLKRIRFGPVTIRKLPLGAVRPLHQREITGLEKMTHKGGE
jgi:23S rRNA pseudouridine2605 synthase